MWLLRRLRLRSLCRGLRLPARLALMASCTLTILVLLFKANSRSRAAIVQFNVFVEVPHHPDGPADERTISGKFKHLLSNLRERVPKNKEDGEVVEVHLASGPVPHGNFYVFDTSGTASLTDQVGLFDERDKGSVSMVAFVY